MAGRPEESGHVYRETNIKGWRPSVVNGNVYHQNLSTSRLSDEGLWNIAVPIPLLQQQWAFNHLWKAGATIPKVSDEDDFQKFKDYCITHGHWDDKDNNPFHIFFYRQIPAERKRIEDAQGSSTPDINTKAYRNVKEIWVTRCIWNPKWEMLPGMSWMHEERVGDSTRSAPPIPKNPPKNSNGEPREGPVQADLGFTSPTGPNNRQEPSGANLAQRHPPRFMNKQVERAPLAVNLHPAGNDKQNPSRSMSLRPRVPQAPVNQLRRPQSELPDRKRQSQDSGKKMSSNTTPPSSSAYMPSSPKAKDPATTDSTTSPKPAATPKLQSPRRTKTKRKKDKE